MKEMKAKQRVQRAVNNALSGMEDDPWMAQRVLCQAHEQSKGEKVMKKKFSIGLAMMMAVLLLGAAALAATLLWQDAGEKLAPIEGKHGYYDTWNAENKTALVKTLYDLGELAGQPDAEALLNSADMPESEKAALCDSILSAYVGGSPDTVTLLSILEKLHGDISTWPMEDRVWYNQLLSANGLLTEEDANYVLPLEGEITQEQAIEAAQAFLLGKGAEGLEDARIEATMYEETNDHFDGETQVSQKGRRVWSIVFRLEGEAYQADIAADGSMLGYTLPELAALFVRGTLPGDAAIPEAKALEIGTSALSAQVSQEELAQAKVFYGYIDLADEAAAHAKLGEHVWLVTTEQHYALVNTDGEVIFAGERH